MSIWREEDKREMDEIIRIAKCFRMTESYWCDGEEDDTPKMALGLYMLRALNDINETLALIANRMKN